ncbi:MAG: hypothetical protein WKG06_25250 [Segetibacter sp.]
MSENVTYEQGVTGMAYKGGADSYIKYTSANDFSSVKKFYHFLLAEKRMVLQLQELELNGFLDCQPQQTYGIDMKCVSF